MRPLSLAHLTVLDLSPPEMIRVAGEVGYVGVGLRLIAVTPTTPGYPLMDDPATLRETLRANRETGVAVNDIEFLRLTPEFEARAFEPFLTAGAELGARHVITAPYDPDLSRLSDNLAALAVLSAGYGLSPVLEFFPWTNVPSLAAALDLVERGGQPALSILLDTLHFDRSNSALDDIDRAAGRLPFIHLCDAPVQAHYSEADLLHAARADRLPPGEGAIPLGAILDRLSPDIPITLEIPMAGRRAQGSSIAVATDAFERTQAFFTARTEAGSRNAQKKDTSP